MDYVRQLSPHIGPIYKSSGVLTAEIMSDKKKGLLVKHLNRPCDIITTL